MGEVRGVSLLSAHTPVKTVLKGKEKPPLAKPTLPVFLNFVQNTAAALPVVPIQLVKATPSYLERWYKVWD